MCGLSRKRTQVSRSVCKMPRRYRPHRPHRPPTLLREGSVRGKRGRRTAKNAEFGQTVGTRGRCGRCGRCWRAFLHTRALCWSRLLGCRRSEEDLGVFQDRRYPRSRRWIGQRGALSGCADCLGNGRGEVEVCARCPGATGGCGQPCFHTPGSWWRHVRQAPGVSTQNSAFRGMDGSPVAPLDRRARGPVRMCGLSRKRTQVGPRTNPEGHPRPGLSRVRPKLALEVAGSVPYHGARFGA
jgi:hypothetical protein